MTRLLYYEDPELCEFEATLVERRDRDGRPEVRLDRTAFYPEGGGQPADRGELAGVDVVHVRKEDGEVYHVLGARLDAEAGATVPARVDAQHRRDYRQQHTGQHILSAALVRVGGYATVSVHQGSDVTTIEVDAEEIPPADLEAVERLANEAIEADLPVNAEWVSEETIDRFPLRRPPKVSGSIRVVEVGDFDCVACGGVHTARTGEIRLVHAVGVETIRGHARIAWKIGDRALAHYRRTSDIANRLGSMLSAQPNEIVERVEKQEARIREADLENRRLHGRLHELVAKSLLTDAEPEHGRRIVTAGFDGESSGFLRGVTEQLVSTTGVGSCLVNRDGDRLHWTIGLAPGSGLAFDTVRDELLPLVDGKGGGKPPIWQGIGTRPEGAQAFLAAFRRLAERARSASRR